MATFLRFCSLLLILHFQLTQAGATGHGHLHVSRPRSLHKRALGISANLPANWTSKGCYTDSVQSRALQGKGYADGAMTQEACISFCSNGGYVYAGVEVCTEAFHVVQPPHSRWWGVITLQPIQNSP